MKQPLSVPFEAQKPRSLFLSDDSLGLATDLYELTMAAAYFESGNNPLATFELFIRRMPEGRSFLIAAGLEQVVHYLENLRFTEEEVSFLQRLPVFRHVSQPFFDYLAQIRFTGDLWAMPEGTVFFAGEPVLRVTAPIIEAQIVETYLLSTVNFQTSIASKAARMALAAGPRSVVEFGTRRAHGMQAGVLAARASYLGGCSGTSNVLAAQLAGIPAFGTMAHSFVMAFVREIDAFKQYQEIFPKSAILLVDTYDTVLAVQKAIDAGLDFQGVRLDSGNLLRLSRKVRKILDASGRQQVQIVASGDLNEWLISDLVGKGAPVNAFGVGTELSTSRDQPALGGVYKLVTLQSSGKTLARVKLSTRKLSFPGTKQIYRVRNGRGEFLRDWMCLQEEKGPAGSEPLLVPVMRAGRQVAPLAALDASRELARQQLQALPAALRDLERCHRYPVKISPRLRKLKADLIRRVSP